MGMLMSLALFGSSLLLFTPSVSVVPRGLSFDLWRASVAAIWIKHYDQIVRNSFLNHKIKGSKTG